MKIAKFTGEFQGLKSCGFNCADEYMTVDGICISSLNRRILIDRFSEYSFLVVEAILNGEHKKWQKTFYVWNNSYSDNYCFWLDRKNCILFPCQDIKKSPELEKTFKVIEMEKENSSEEEILAYIYHFHEQWQFVQISDNQLYTIEELIKKNELELCESEV